MANETMNAEGAIEQLNAGKKVRKTHWVKGCYISLVDNEVRLNWNKLYDFKTYGFSNNDDIWELYEDEFCLSNKIQMIYGEDILDPEDVREFIRRVIGIFDIEDSKMFTAYDIIEKIKRFAGKQLVELDD